MSLRFFSSLMVSLLSIQVLISGCSSLQPVEPVREPLHLYIRSSAPSYQPGELVAIEVLLLNASDMVIEATPLNHETLTFWMDTPELAEPVRAEPVFSEKEQTLESALLEGAELWSRTFFFTRASEFPGEVTVQATYQSDPGRILGDPHFVSSRTIDFGISGERTLERDRDGILLQSEASRIAREYWGDPDLTTTEKLIINEAGFFDWVVFEGEERAVLVSPYRGAVRRDADPAALKEKEEAKKIMPVYKQDQRNETP